MGRTCEKLVRDRIPELIEAQGETPLVEVLDDEAYLRCLDEKMREELEEYLEDGSMAELADLLEVIRAVIAARGYTWDEVERMRVAKAQQNGAFERKLYLRGVEKQLPQP
ncbi:MAG: phosphoribosyl-ATP pyrophosphohydrolase [Candidatus Spyradocola sp.]